MLGEFYDLLKASHTMYPDFVPKTYPIKMKEKTVNIILVDDHQFVIDGLKEILKNSPDINIIQTTNRGEDLLKFLNQNNQTSIDLILMDVSMNEGELNGIETAEIVKRQFPGIKILMLTVNDDYDTFKKARRAGVDGYIPKIKGKKAILEAINKSIEGDFFIDFLNQA